MRRSVSTRRVTTRDGVGLHVVEGVGDGRAVLCLPGALGTAMTDFRPTLEGALGSGFQAVSFDPRGYGESRPPQRDFPLDFYVRDALDGADVMSALGHERYSVMGWSDGAIAAIHLAARLPERVESLVVWGGNAYITAADIEAWEGLRDVRATWSKRMRESLAAVYGGENELQALNDRFTDGMVRLFKERAGDVCLGEVHQVRCPTLVVHGAKDAMVGPEHARYLCANIPRAAPLVEMPEGKHNLHLRYATEFHALAADFLGAEADASDTVPAGGAPDINSIAYGFMGSKALFTALSVGVFDAIAEAGPGGSSVEEIEAAVTPRAAGERLRTLLTACTALGLVRHVEASDKYVNAPSTARELVKKGKHYWGDYLTLQVSKQFYNRMAELDEIMASGSAAYGYNQWFADDPEAAAQYTKAQHNGSLATAASLLRKLDLSGVREFLDVGGGSGAFAIALCRKYPDARATVLDLPSVVAKTTTIVAEESPAVAARIAAKGLSATFEWGVPDEHYDVINMSYLTGSVPADTIAEIYRRAYRALRPGGRIIIHDFMVHNNANRGPANAALWALAHVTVNPQGAGLAPKRIVQHLSDAGFVAPRVEPMIHSLTQLVHATKPMIASL